MADWKLCEQRLAQGLRVLKLSPDVVRPGVVYLRELERWNLRHNLTAVRDPVDMVSRHLLDSLAIEPYIRAGRLADVGSGAGLPGIPLALARPDIKVTLVESNGKKAAFLRHVVRHLALDHVEVVESRSESFAPPVPFDTVVSRAVASLATLIAWCDHLRGDTGRLLAMKGRVPDDEICELPSGWKAVSHAVVVPGLDESRHLIELENT